MYRLYGLALLAFLLAAATTLESRAGANGRPVAGPVSGATGCWRRTCPTCSGYEMAGFDASRMLARPPRAKVKKAAVVKKSAVKRKAVRKVARKPLKGRISVTPKPKTSASLIPGLQEQRPRIARQTVHMAPHRTIIPNPGPKRVSISTIRFLDCEELRVKAQELLNEGRTDDANRLLKEAIEADPTDRCPRLLAIDLNLCRARTFYACQEYECAARLIREALFLDPNHWQANSMLESVYKATGVNPLDPAARLKVAQYLEKNKRLVGAMVEYRAAIAHGGTAQAHAGLASVALQLDQKALALSEYQKAAIQDPSNIDYFRQIGFLKKDAADVSGAAASFEQALVLRPNDPIAGEALIGLRQSQLSGHPSGVANRIAMGRALLASGNKQAAITEFDKIAAENPKNVSLQGLAQTELAKWQNKQDFASARYALPAAASDPLTQFLQEGPTPVNYSTGSTVDPARLFATGKSCSCH